MREGVGQDFDRDVAAERGVARAEDLAHAAGAQRGDDVICAEAGAGSQGHAGTTPEGYTTFRDRLIGYGGLQERVAPCWPQLAISRATSSGALLGFGLQGATRSCKTALDQPWLTS